MDKTLTSLQIRIIGCLLEKEVTTPDQYPLSLNTLTNACNQKSNREPVMELTEAQVQDTLDELISLRLVTLDEGLSGRVNKYAHRFCNTTFSSLQISEQEKAILCVLFLRGPQTPGELRTRTNRLADFNNVAEVEDALNTLANQEPQKVTRLAKEPGKREARYAQLFSELDESIMASNSTAEPEPSIENATVIELKQEVAALKQELAKIKQHLGL